MRDTPVIGIVSAPAWFDPAPSEFPTVVEEDVRTQQAPLLLPDFDYRLESIARVQPELNHCARSLAAMGCHLVAQVGSPFAWAGALSESDARMRSDSMDAAAGIPVVMTSLAIVDGLRALGATSVALNCTYYDTDWRNHFEAFMRMCAFDVRHASTLVDQGLIPPDSQMKDVGWNMTDDLARRSILSVAEASPEADAIVVTGAGTRTLSLLADMESRIQRPIIAADTILYWAIARELNLTLKPTMGSLANIRGQVVELK